MLPYLHIFGFSLPMYGLLAVVGVCAAYLYVFLTNRGGKAGQIPRIDVLHIILLAVVGALVGGKLLSILTLLPAVIQNWSHLMQHPALLLQLLGPGLVFYGGFIGGAVAVFWYCRRYSLSLKTVLAIYTPAIPLFHTFGRIGCFCGGCCWGIEVPWGISFTQSLAAPNHVPLLPLQLIEAGCNFVLFLVLAALSHRLREKWKVFPIYILCYSALRFVLEFFRGDALRGVWLLSTSQWLALAMMLGVLLFYLFGRRTTARRLQ